MMPLHAILLSTKTPGQFSIDTSCPIHFPGSRVRSSPKIVRSASLTGFAEPFGCLPLAVCPRPPAVGHPRLFAPPPQPLAIINCLPPPPSLLPPGLLQASRSGRRRGLRGGRPGHGGNERGAQRRYAGDAAATVVAPSPAAVAPP